MGRNHCSRCSGICIPLISSQGTAYNKQDFDITGLDLSKKNKLTYDFKFGVVKVGECSAVQAGGEYGVIDGSSTIDVSGFEHYIALPDLNVFANSGFPFTKFADLEQTTLIMQKESSAQAIQLLLNFTGRLGEITGYPTHRLDIEFPDPSLTASAF
ncbi:cellulose biosynthesis cyclic di-GMP-binding regulatory protein BcsB [Pseudoalteromonas sp. AOP31-A2-14]|uniref:cellulose biosynthesis cyclic di-GMP-binding regulatory protein BcsB n=1 Tax=Pseudoalteromonas sp. AOP31-A2-14 TaxID=3457695 RepID=UPI00403631DA